MSSSLYYLPNKALSTNDFLKNINFTRILSNKRQAYSTKKGSGFFFIFCRRNNSNS
jgi:hypothetical protein